VSGWSGRKVERLTNEVVAAYGFTCWLCHTDASLDVHYMHPARLTVDHVLPRSLGGSDDLANLRPAHRRCNLSRGNRPGRPTGRVRPAESGGRFFSGDPLAAPPPTSSSPRTLRKNGEFSPERRGKVRI